MQAYILLALYRHRDHVGGYDASDVVTYVWLTQGMLTAVQVFGWTELALRIRSGDVATDLARPVHPFFAGLAFEERVHRSCQIGRNVAAADAECELGPAEY